MSAEKINITQQVANVSFIRDVSMHLLMTQQSTWDRNRSPSWVFHEVVEGAEVTLFPRNSPPSFFRLFLFYLSPTQFLGYECVDKGRRTRDQCPKNRFLPFGSKRGFYSWGSYYLLALVRWYKVLRITGGFARMFQFVLLRINACFVTKLRFLLEHWKVVSKYEWYPHSSNLMPQTHISSFSWRNEKLSAAANPFLRRTAPTNRIFLTTGNLYIIVWTPGGARAYHTWWHERIIFRGTRYTYFLLFLYSQNSMTASANHDATSVKGTARQTMNVDVILVGQEKTATNALWKLAANMEPVQDHGNANVRKVGLATTVK